MSGVPEFTNEYRHGHQVGGLLVRDYGVRWTAQWQTTVGQAWHDVAIGRRSTTWAQRFLRGVWHGVLDARARNGF